MLQVVILSYDVEIIASRVHLFAISQPICTGMCIFHDSSVLCAFCINKSLSFRVAANGIPFAAVFYQKSLRSHSAAAPFKNEPAARGFVLVMPCAMEMPYCHSHQIKAFVIVLIRAFPFCRNCISSKSTRACPKSREKSMDNRKQEQETRQIISDRFRAYWGKKERSWDIPDGLTPTKAARAAQKAAAEWEQNAKAECEAERKTPKRKRKRAIDRTKSDVADFPENTWFPHCVCQGEHKRTTVEFFEIS